MPETQPPTDGQPCSIVSGDFAPPQNLSLKDKVFLPFKLNGSESQAIDFMALIDHIIYLESKVDSLMKAVQRLEGNDA